MPSHSPDASVIDEVLHTIYIRAGAIGPLKIQKVIPIITWRNLHALRVCEFSLARPTPPVSVG